MMDCFSLAGKVAWITGASAGIGFAIAEAYVRQGAQVVFNSRTQEHMQQACLEYEKRGIPVWGLTGDCTDSSQVEVMVQKILNRFGRLDILVNNAGIIRRTPFLDQSPDEFRQVLEVDLVAPFLCAQAVLPHMIQRGSGKIINLCSMMSELGRETVAAYASAKGGLKLLTQSICAEFGSANIQCNGIGPGYIATEQTAPLRETDAQGNLHPFDSFLRARTPAARWGTVEDLQGPAIFLASSASDFVNGHILYVDGGILAYIGKQP